MNLWTFWKGVRGHYNCSSEVSACLGRREVPGKLWSRSMPQHVRAWISPLLKPFCWVCPPYHTPYLLTVIFASEIHCPFWQLICMLLSFLQILAQHLEYRMDSCICMAESLGCWPETITTLLISYTPIQNEVCLKKNIVSIQYLFWLIKFLFM